MNYIILSFLFLFSGFFMKYSDDLFDVNHDLMMASGIGVLCGLASAFATISDVGAAYIFISILIGNFIVLKVASASNPSELYPVAQSVTVKPFGLYVPVKIG